MISKEEEKSKAKEAAKKLNVQLGVPVGSAYGITNIDKISEPAEWYLIVWSNKKVYGMPETFEGYRVVRRDMPVAASDKA